MHKKWPKIIRANLWSSG